METAAAVMELRNFIGGRFVRTEGLLDTVEPATGHLLARLPNSGAEDVDQAVAAAKAAFPAWKALSCSQRAHYLLRVADLLEARLDEFAEAESRDQGKPVWLARAMDIPRAVLNLRHFAHTAPHQLGVSKMVPESSSLNYTVHEPLGVAGLISPWNLPLYLLTFKLAPALVCGNTVVAKPSELTSVTAHMLCELFVEAGLPPGVLNMVLGGGISAGAALTLHPDVPILSFTGSTLTGAKIARATAPLFKKLSLEMGGKNAAIVFEDCDLEATVSTLTRAAFTNQGQVCLCTSRIFVHKNIYETFVEKFIESARQQKVGDPRDPTVKLGALNSDTHFKKVCKCVRQAVEDGGRVRCGYTVDELELPRHNVGGYFMGATVITDMPDTAKCMTDEIFGPVACVTSFETEDEVVTRANSVRYGLCAAVFTNDISRATRTAHAMQVGTVWTNCWLVRDLDLPFGGVKESGMGREGTKDSWHFFTEEKTICVKI